MERSSNAVVIDGTSFLIEVVERDGRWTAVARREDTGDRFGPPVHACTPNEAMGRLINWLEWQREHTAALEALQDAEAAYLRIVAGSAFLTGTDALPPIDLQREALARLEEARGRLDEIRQRRPV